MLKKPGSNHLLVKDWRPEKLKSDGTHKHDCMVIKIKGVKTGICRSCAMTNMFWNLNAKI